MQNEQVSTYEQMRLANIQRNEAFLERVGLIGPIGELSAIAIAKKPKKLAKKPKKLAKKRRKTDGVAGDEGSSRKKEKKKKKKEPKNTSNKRKAKDMVSLYLY